MFVASAGDGVTNGIGGERPTTRIFGRGSHNLCLTSSPHWISCSVTFTTYTSFLSLQVGQYLLSRSEGDIAFPIHLKFTLAAWAARATY